MFAAVKRDRRAGGVDPDVHAAMSRTTDPDPDEFDVVLTKVRQRDRELIERGFRGGESFVTIAADAGVTAERIRQRVERVMERLRERAGWRRGVIQHGQFGTATSCGGAVA